MNTNHNRESLYSHRGFGRASPTTTQAGSNLRPAFCSSNCRLNTHCYCRNDIWSLLQKTCLPEVRLMLHTVCCGSQLTAFVNIFSKRACLKSRFPSMALSLDFKILVFNRRSTIRITISIGHTMQNILNLNNSQTVKNCRTSVKRPGLSTET
jgi:hypothetical protein